VLLYRSIPLALLAIWWISTATVPAAGEPPLTVEQLVEIAVEVNPQVRAAKEQRDAARITRRRTRPSPTETWTAARISTRRSTLIRSAKVSSFRERRCCRRMRPDKTPRSHAWRMKRRSAICGPASKVPTTRYCSMKP
jgi:hypothetical protein